MSKRKKTGFTLIEMIVVIAILAVLSIAVIPLISNLIDKSRISRFLADSDLVRTSSLSFQADLGSLEQTQIFFASNEITTSSLCVNRDIAGNNLARWDGPYLESGIDTSPWGGIYDLEFRDIDNEIPDTGTALFKPIDLTLEATQADENGELAPVPNAPEVVAELNKFITGNNQGGDNVRAQVFGGTQVAIVVLANVSN